MMRMFLPFLNTRFRPVREGGEGREGGREGRGGREGGGEFGIRK